MNNTTQIKNVKYESLLLIWLLIYLVIKNLNKIVTERFIRDKILKISVVFIRQSYFVAPKKLILKIPNNWELQQFIFHHSSDMDLKEFMNFYKKCTAKPYSLLVIDASITSDNLVYFRRKVVERI